MAAVHTLRTLLLAFFAGWACRHQAEEIKYLVEEKRAGCHQGRATYSLRTWQSTTISVSSTNMSSLAAEMRSR